MAILYWVSVDVLNDVVFSHQFRLLKIICKEPCDLIRIFNVLILSAMNSWLGYSES